MLLEAPQEIEDWMDAILSGILAVSRSAETSVNACPPDIVREKLSPLTVIESRTASLPVTVQLWPLMLRITLELKVTSPVAKTKEKGNDIKTTKIVK